MKTYEIQYTRAADRFFAKHEDIRRRYEECIRELISGEDRNVDIKRIKGVRSDYYRIRIGKYRVIYTLINGKIVVIKTISAGSRGDIYKKTDI
ncbi:MAG: type II toxin-antitoxin system RelE/ParE family toxin [Erysipelotrichaceae bacterium]|nr:type II toxin-antitoxin system RelE/ParE family toxin [Erysipelotrichaceae bacterium]